MSRETEAKFSVSDLVSFNHVEALRELAGFALSDSEQKAIRDVYWDTEGRALLRAGWALRFRHGGGEVLVTAKRLDAGSGRAPIHEREELETRMPRAVGPAEWPDGELRRTVLAVTEGQPIVSLFEIQQERRVRELMRGERAAAEMSLDQVRVMAGDHEREYMELEIELKPEGTRDELLSMVTAVERELSLAPSPRSKFEEGLLLLDGGAPAVEPDGQSKPRASPRQPARVSEKRKRLEMPFGIAEEATLGALSRLGYRFRARSRKEETRWYFDSQGGGLFKQGAELYFSGQDSRWHFLREGRPVHSQKGASDVLPAVGPVALSVQAITRAFPGVPYLETNLRETSFSLASISGANLAVTTRVWQLRSPLHDVPATISLTLTLEQRQASVFELDYLGGLLTKELGARELHGLDLHHALVHLGAPLPGAPLPQAFLPARGDDAPTLSNKILSGEAWRMKANTPGAIQDLDPEFVHDLRVATRRARFACRLFTAALGRERSESIRRELSWIAELLGAVRDLDVLRERLESQLPLVDAEQSFHQALARVITARRERARELLVQALTSPRYSALLDLMSSANASTPQNQAPDGPAAEALGRKRIARALGKIAPWVRRDLRELSSVELHRLRILFKRLRYTAEFFRAILGEAAARLARECVRYQDCLGMHQDARVAIDVFTGLADDPAIREQPTAGLLALGALIQIQRDTMKEQREKLRTLWGSVSGLFDPRSGRGSTGPS